MHSTWKKEDLLNRIFSNIGTDKKSDFGRGAEQYQNMEKIVTAWMLCVLYFIVPCQIYQRETAWYLQRRAAYVLDQWSKHISTMGRITQALNLAIQEELFTLIPGGTLSYYHEHWVVIPDDKEGIQSYFSGHDHAEIAEKMELDGTYLLDSGDLLTIRYTLDTKQIIATERIRG